MNIVELPSPNQDSRNGATVDVLVIHYTDTQSGQHALDILTNPVREVSSHYTIDEDGSVYRHVQEDMRAWHAGVSHWRGRDSVNAFSIGIELVNPGLQYGYRPFPLTQMHALAELCHGILQRHSIPARNVVGHSDVAPERKKDPGELFNWEWLAGEGIGLWPEFGQRSISNINRLLPGDRNDKVFSMQQRLHEYGYGIPVTGIFCDVTHKVATAFQRHFRPQDCSGIWDTDSDARLDELLASL